MATFMCRTWARVVYCNSARPAAPWPLRAYLSLPFQIPARSHGAFTSVLMGTSMWTLACPSQIPMALTIAFSSITGAPAPRSPSRAAGLHHDGRPNGQPALLAALFALYPCRARSHPDHTDHRDRGTGEGAAGRSGSGPTGIPEQRGRDGGSEPDGEPESRPDGFPRFGCERADILRTHRAAARGDCAARHPVGKPAGERGSV